MKKDVFIAVAIGVLIGAIIAIILINLPSLIPNKSVRKIPQPTLPGTNTTDTNEHTKPLSLIIDYPQDNIISKTSSLEIQGIATSSSLIILDSRSGAKTVKVQKDGKFTIPVNLDEGGNEIYVTAYNDNGDSDIVSLTVFYTSEKL